MQRITSLKKGALKGKTVLLRVDFNVEIVRGKIADDYRIRASLPTIQWLLQRGAKPILLSHLARPRRKDAKYSLRPVARYLSELLGRRVILFEEWDDLAPFWRILPDRTIGMLENLRFWPGEEKNDAGFARRLAQLGDLYVNDAFAVSHRKNASVVAITKYLPSYAGMLLWREIEMLERIRTIRRRPFVAILGGKKLSDKLPLIRAFIKKADAILTGGGVANTFLLAKGVDVGQSIVERQFVPVARRMLSGTPVLHVPSDWKIGKGKAIFDIGPRTVRDYRRVIAGARMILWNGPMGVFEDSKFAKGSWAIARAIAKNTRAFSVVGGGETIACVRQAIPHYELLTSQKRLFLSTGGGAMLEYLAGKKLPGIEALKRAKAPHVKRQ